MLSDDQVRGLWGRFEVPEWEGWRASYRRLLDEVHGLSDAALAGVEVQERLWSAREVCTLGPGESIDVRGAWSDPEVVRAVVALRRRAWPEAAEERAEAIQAAFTALLGLVSPRHTAARPNGRLHRLMATLLPAELHCVISWSANRDVNELLLSPRLRLAPVASHVMVRARLAEALGDCGAGDHEAHARRSMFCWWLHGQAEPLRKGHGIITPARPDGEPPSLALWPAARQSRAPLPPSLEIHLRALVRLSTEGATAEDLLEALDDESPAGASLVGRARRGLARRAEHLGLLERRHGLLYPTEAGRELIEGDQPDVLVERLIQRSFGFGALLRALEAGAEGARSLIARLSRLDPAWSRSGVPAAIVECARSLGLAGGADDGALTLTDYGRAWAARLPEALPELPPPAAPAEEPTVIMPPFAEIEAALAGAPAAARLVLDRSQVMALHVAWTCHPGKRFVILSGLSGVGKTALAIAYAEACCDLLGLDTRQHRALVPVGPDWRDPSGFLGYINVLREVPVFHVEPALRLILRASADPGRPYFLILDEMNLARVERYMASALSAMETGEALVLHGHGDAIGGVPSRVRWPSNLFIAGTVNMDETTHDFSDKVLDRAFALEFWAVDLPRFFALEAERSGAPLERVEAVLIGLDGALRPVRRHFGYRTAGEVMRYVRAATAIDAEAEVAALDQAIFSRVLPRLRGEDSPGLRSALAGAREVCEGAGLARSAEKLGELRSRLQSLGVTRFWA